MYDPQRQPIRRDCGSVRMVALFVMIVLSVFGVAQASFSGTESNIGFNQPWPDASFAAADAGMRIGLKQLSANAAISGQAIAVTAIGTGAFAYQFRSGHLTDAGPSPILIRKVAGRGLLQPGDQQWVRPFRSRHPSLPSQHDGVGRRTAQRDLEALAECGPVVQ